MPPARVTARAQSTNPSRHRVSDKEEGWGGMPEVGKRTARMLPQWVVHSKNYGHVLIWHRDLPFRSGLLRMMYSSQRHNLVPVLLKVYVIGAVKSIHSTECITHSFWKFFWHCHIVCPPPTSQQNRTISSQNVILWFLRGGDFDFYQPASHLHPVWL